MSKKSILLPLLLCLFGFGLTAQTIEDLTAQKVSKEAELKILQDEIDAIEKQLYEFPGWKFGGVGLVGFNSLINDNWYAIGTPNSSNNTFSLGLSGYANNDQEKYFWRNLVNANLTRSATREDRDIKDNEVIAVTNGLDVSSLFGYKLNEDWAVSVEGKWISSLLEYDPDDNSYDFKLNAPGQATISAGATWTPINDLVVIIHPIGYQKNWPGDFVSAAGAKIGATYAAEIVRNISWSSNLSAFIPYTGDETVEHKNIDDALIRSVDYSGGDLVNWTWINSFSTSIWKGIGVSFNIGLRGDKQIADLGKLRIADANGTDVSTVDTDKNPLQSYYTFGLSYTF